MTSGLVWSYHVSCKGEKFYETNLHTIDFASCHGMHADQLPVLESLPSRDRGGGEMAYPRTPE